MPKLQSPFPPYTPTLWKMFLPSFPKYIGAFTGVQTPVILALSHKSCSQSRLLWAPCPSSKAADLHQPPWLVPGQLASLLCNEEGNFTLPMGDAHQGMVVVVVVVGGGQGLSCSRVTWTPKMWSLVKQLFEFAFRALLASRVPVGHLCRNHDSSLTLGPSSWTP